MFEILLEALLEAFELGRQGISVEKRANSRQVGDLELATEGTEVLSHHPPCGKATNGFITSSPPPSSSSISRKSGDIGRAIYEYTTVVRGPMRT